MEELSLTTPHGNNVTLFVRPGTNDADMARSCLVDDEYNLKNIPAGSIEIAADVGAHIGMLAIGLAVDHPDATVLAVEPLPENIELMIKNIDRNNVSNRVFVIEGAAAKNSNKKVDISWNHAGDEVASVHRFIGNQAMSDGVTSLSVSVNPITVDELTSYGFIDLMVIDCEGGEYEMFGSTSKTSLAARRNIREIRGEFHRGFSKFESLLTATHEVTNISGGTDFGGFVARVRE